jgi:chemotaxis protein MotB
MKKKDPINLKRSLFPIQEFEAEEENSWQVSYLDIITIVLGFLIILLSVSQIPKTEFSSLSQLFGRLADETEFYTTPIGNIQDELYTLLEPEIEAGNLEIIRDLNDLKIRFKSDDLYQSGEATLQSGSEYLLDRVLISMQQLEYNDFNIDVEGHTDNTPIASVAYPSNWELSTARAANVVKYFNDLGIPSKRLKASGYADSRPVIEYDSLGFPFAASKERNRRVVLRLYYTTDTLLEERLEEEQVAENPITEESLAGELPDLTPIPEPSDNDVLVLADQPAIVTLADENQIEEAIANRQEIEDLPEEQDPPIVNNPPPVQQPEPEPEARQPEQEVSIPIESSSAMPSLLKVDRRCQFAVQMGEYDALQSAFQQAARIESAISASLILTYNNENYSIRTEAINSFSDALNLQNNVSDRLNDSDVAVVHQCYKNTVNRPKPVKYLIQFGAYQNRTNAIEYTMELWEQFGIQAKMNRVADSYNVLTGPYTSRSEVLSQLQSFRETGIASNLFIRHQPETVFDYEYAYQIQVNVFDNINSASSLAQEVRSATGINTRVEELVSGSFSVMTGQSQSWNETQTIFNRLRNSSLNTDAVIFFLEFTP